MAKEKNDSKKGNVFVVAAPSGAGKTTLITEVIKRLQKDFPISRVITYTTREPRREEINGTDYFFLSHDEFEQKRKEGLFLETTVYDGKFYGSPASILTDLELGKSFVLVTDLEGVKSLSKLFKDDFCIWILAPDLKELRRRLLARNTDSNMQVERRVKLAQEEMKAAEGMSRIFNFNVTNNVFEETVAELIMIMKNELGK